MARIKRSGSGVRGVIKASVPFSLLFPFPFSFPLPFSFLAISRAPGSSTGLHRAVPVPAGPGATPLSVHPSTYPSIHSPGALRAPLPPCRAPLDPTGNPSLPLSPNTSTPKRLGVLPAPPGLISAPASPGRGARSSQAPWQK